jgi:hypothetical protein
MSFSPYETLYGSALLDEIHNHYPALLYAPDEFSNIRDVLNYVQQQTRSRYDLFSYGQRQYRERTSQNRGATNHSARTSYAPAPVPRRPPHPNPSVEQNEEESEEESEEENDNTITATFRITESSPIAPSIFTNLIQPQEDTRLAQTLFSLLGLPIQTPTQSQNANLFWNQFLQPIPVAPTPEQIRQYTTVGEVPTNIEVCIICQDNFEISRQGRLLNACGHWFHQNCIDTWFQRNVRCPICRHDIRTPASPHIASRATNNSRTNP